MTKEKQLFRILFIISICLLLLNDFYLKYEYHNYLTGKLSDFAGLFAFPYFFSCFFPKRIKLIYIFSGILFLIWKSEFSQPVFDFAHSYGIGIGRTVDYWDLLALCILPLSYQYWKKDYKTILKPKRIVKPIIIAICCFSFVATTLARKSENYNFKSDFEIIIKMDIDSVKSKIHFYELEQVNRSIYSIQISDRKTWIDTKIEIEELQDGQLKIKLDSILNYSLEESGNIFYSRFDKDDVNYVEGLSKLDIEKLFATQLKEQLSRK